MTRQEVIVLLHIVYFAIKILDFYILIDSIQHSFVKKVILERSLCRLFAAQRCFVIFFSNCLKQARTSENNSSILAFLLEVAEKLLHLHSRLENRFCTQSSLTRKNLTTEISFFKKKILQFGAPHIDLMLNEIVQDSNFFLVRLYFSIYSAYIYRTF